MQERRREGAPGRGPLNLEGAWAWSPVAAATLLTRGPVLFSGLILRATDAGVGDVTVYDGHNAGGRLYMDYTLPASETRSFPEDPPALLQNGLFIDVGSNVGRVLVRYRPLPTAPPREPEPQE